MSHQATDAPHALVVDDDHRIRSAACDILESAGFLTLEAENGDEAVPVLSRHAESIVLLFTDVEMPGHLDGFALAREVVRRWPHISVVVASGRRTPEFSQLPEQATFISKPFSAEIVHHEIARLLPDGQKPASLKRKVGAVSQG